VADIGMGIAPEDQAAVFEELRQAGTSAKRAEGTGLGLAFSRKFVEVHARLRALPHSRRSSSWSGSLRRERFSIASRSTWIRSRRCPRSRTVITVVKLLEGRQRVVQRLQALKALPMAHSTTSAWSISGGPDRCGGLP
jgi:hypothetical protein